MERIERLTAIADTLFWLGQLAEVSAWYHTAIEECSERMDPERWGRLVLGIGLAHYAAGDAASFADWTQRAVAALTRSGSTESVVAQHHLGRILAAQGEWERVTRRSS